MLGEHGGREAPGEHREHGGQHGGVDAVVAGGQAAREAGCRLGEVLRQGGWPRDGGQLEEVLREGVVVGQRGQRHPADGEGEGGNNERVGEGCVDQMTVLESFLLSSRVCRGGDFVLITFVWFFLHSQVQSGLVGVVRLWLCDGLVVVQHEGVGVADPGEGGVGAAVWWRHWRGLGRVTGREVVRGELRHLPAQPGEDVVVLRPHLVVAVDLVQVVHQLLQPRQVALLRGPVPPA